MSESDFPLPPPTFEFLVFSLKAQAEMQLGLYGFSGDTAETQFTTTQSMPSTMLSMVSKKTRGNLALEEQRLIENSLTELRFRFVQISDERAKVAKAPAADTESKGEGEAKPEAKTDEDSASAS